jgi:glucose-6-phosphate dehydrogenase assembly protein OpcA
MSENPPSPVATVEPERIRSLRWSGEDVELEDVVAQLRRMQNELAAADPGDHPHPRNCVLNLVVTLGDHHRALACDRLVASLGPSHPLRAILLHLGGGDGPGDLDAELMSEAHQLLRGFPVQREQILLHVRGGAAEHLASLVEPLLVPDVPTYLWWSEREPLGDQALQEAMRFTDVLVVDSLHFHRPAGSLLEIADLIQRHESPIGVTDFRWSRLRPWMDAIGQFFSPGDRQAFLTGLESIEAECAGSGPASRITAALLVGWAASALRWRFLDVRAEDPDRTTAVVEDPAGRRVPLALRSTPGSRQEEGKLVAVRVAARAGGRRCTVAIEKEASGGHARLTIDLGGPRPVQQRLTLPRQDDANLLVQALWSSRRDPVFERALIAAVPLLEVMR